MTTQSIAASLIGTGLGIALSNVTGADSVNVIMAFIPLTMLWYVITVWNSDDLIFAVIMQRIGCVK